MSIEENVQLVKNFFAAMGKAATPCAGLADRRKDLVEFDV